MTKKEFVLDVGLTAAVLVFNLGEEMQERYGVMGASGHIGTFAYKFCKKYKHVKEWEYFCHSQGFCDWEEFLCLKAIKKFKL